MKKTLSLTLMALLFCGCMAFGLTACGEEPCNHTYDNACDTLCNVCGEERTITHEPNEDDGDCTTAITCSVCETITTEAKAHTPNADDGNCLTAITCSICGTVTTEARTAHEGGRATCVSGKLCDFCGYEYDTAIDPENHADKIYTDNNDGTHRVACQCGLLWEEREWHGDGESGIDMHTGNCTCGVFIASVSVIADGATTYYEYIEDAIEVACSINNSTVVLLDEYDVSATMEIDSGNFTIELGGHKLQHHWNATTLIVNGGDVVIKDSVGGGEVGSIKLDSGNLTLQGGFSSDILINSELCTPADILADGYCFYDEDGNVVDISNVESNGNNYYYLYEVTVGAIQ